MQHLRDRVTAAHQEAARCWEPQARLDLKRMIDAVEPVLQQLSREDIQCRKLGRQTSRWHQLLEKYEEIMTNAEQHMLMARLMYG